MNFTRDKTLCENHGNIYDSMVVIVDRYTKMVRYIPARINKTSDQLAQVFIENIMCDKGIPDSVDSDQGSLFTFKYWSVLCFYLKTKQKQSTFFHPQMNCQNERQNPTIEQHLRRYRNYQHDDLLS